MRHSGFVPPTLAVCLAVSLGLVADAFAVEPSIHDAVKASIERKDVHKTEMAGFGIVKTAYRDAGRDGAIVVGFDVAIGRSFNSPTIVAIRPFYLTPRGEVAGNAAGSFSATRDHPVTKIVRLTAKLGYAVGAITLRTGLQIHGMSVTFMPINGSTLDPKRGYRSEWLGDFNEAGKGTTLSGEGAPIMGVFGNVDGRRVIALGLLFAKPAEDEEPTPEPVAASPKVEPSADAHSTTASGLTDPDDAAGSEPHTQSMWLPIAIGAFVVLAAGTLLLVLFRKSASSNQPSPSKPAPNSRRSANPRPTVRKPPTSPEPPAVAACPDDDSIPVVYPCPEDELPTESVA